MNEIWKHVGLFLGIISFFSGIVVLTVNLTVYRGKQNRFYQLLRWYHIAFFAYMLPVFAYYYVEQFLVSAHGVVIINMIGNLTLALLCITHAKIITFLNGNEDSRRYKVAVAGNVFYVVGWIVINALWNNKVWASQIRWPGSLVVWIVEGVLFATLVFFVWGEFRERKKNTWLYFFLVGFSIEYMWEIMYDLAIAEPFFSFTHLMNPFNIIFGVYFLVNMILLVKLYWKHQEEEKEPEIHKVQNKPESREEQIKKAAQEYGLTARECEIVHLLLNRRSNQEIAEQLFISSNTVKHHVSNVFKKMGVSRRTELLRLFHEEEL